MQSFFISLWAISKAAKPQSKIAISVAIEWAFIRSPLGVFTFMRFSVLYAAEPHGESPPSIREELL